MEQDNLCMQYITQRFNAKNEAFTIKRSLKDSRIDVSNALMNGCTDGKLFRLLLKIALLARLEIPKKGIDELTALRGSGMSRKMQIS